jgi:hypothetical protein
MRAMSFDERVGTLALNFSATATSTSCVPNISQSRYTWTRDVQSKRSCVIHSRTSLLEASSKTASHLGALWVRRNDAKNLRHGLLLQMAPR